MKETTNYKFKKIELTDSPPDITAYNPNFDTIDTVMKDLEDSMGETLPDGKTVSEKILEIISEIGDKNKLTTTDKNNLVAAINEIKDELSSHKAEMVHQGEIHGLKTNIVSELEYFNGSDWVPSGWKKPDDPYNNPGSKILLAGDMNAGYFGKVLASDLFTGTELASLVGITEGVSQFNNSEWLKFAIDGSIIYKSQKTYRHSISWDHINSKGCSSGSTQVTKNGITFKVRLMKGLNRPLSEAGFVDGMNCHGSEWNRLILPIHIKASDKNWSYPLNVETNVQYWGIDFTDIELHNIGSAGSGTRHICNNAGNDESQVVYRGYSNDASYSASILKSLIHVNNGWSPVLEVVQ